MAGAAATVPQGASADLRATWAELTERYDGFILDQFGVMHNGAVSLPGAPELISRLHGMGKRLVILSNSSKRAEWSMRELPKLGIDPGAFVGAVTSGEEAWRALRGEWGGSRCVWVAKHDGSGVSDYLEGTSVELAPVQEADVLLCSGTSTIRDGLSVRSVDTEVSGDVEQFRDLFSCAISRHLPMICANPDFVSPPKPGGKETFQPGHLARFYEELGGSVLYYGKPHREHFEACLRMLGLEAHRVAHVGDSMHHDVCGAVNAGVPVIFVAGGIEHEELGIAAGEMPSAERLGTLCARFAAAPTHVVELASWTE